MTKDIDKSMKNNGFELYDGIERIDLVEVDDMCSNEKQRIIDEIKYLKMRLRQIGYNGDCAYEKKLSTYYLNALSLCKEKLLPSRH